MHHRLKPSCQNKNKKLTGSSEFTLKSLLPVNWQQTLPFFLHFTRFYLESSRTISSFYRRESPPQEFKDKKVQDDQY